MDKAESEAVIYTIGYEGTQIEQFTEELVNNNVFALIDVRKNAISRKKGFSKTRLSDKMNAVGIEYIHMPELGIPSSLRKGLDVSRPETYADLFDYYDESILTQADDSIFRIMKLAKEKGNVAITCFESDYRFCHRSRIIEKILSNDETQTTVRHI